METDDLKEALERRAETLESGVGLRKRSVRIHLAAAQEAYVKGDMASVAGQLHSALEVLAEYEAHKARAEQTRQILGWL